MTTRHSDSLAAPQRFVGLDLGTAFVKVAVSPTEDECEPLFFNIPTAISYSHSSAAPIHFSCIGDSAIDRRDHLQLLHPLHS